MTGKGDMMHRHSRRLFTIAASAALGLGLCAAATTSATAAPELRNVTVTVTVAAPLPERMQGRVLTRLATTEKIAALTIDCGGNKAGLTSIRQTLAAKGVRATFFVTGNFARAYPHAVEKIAAAGHRVGNHSNTHPYFTKITSLGVERQIRTTEVLLTQLTGRSPVPFFRFPYGDWNAPVLRQVNGLGYAAIGWTVDSLGWEGTDGGQSADSVYRRVVQAAQPGVIVLLHAGANPYDGTTLDADTLPRVIDWYRSHGFRFDVLRRGLF